MSRDLGCVIQYLKHGESKASGKRKNIVRYLLDYFVIADNLFSSFPLFIC